ncbi:thiol peroxidase (atypical 2-Cys peroxiredoxin) [Aquimarina amphilecti]|uniref:Thiol peroxidase n=1 Tax=Aquimarina amphilecti TaxID=1038014 RepID=A0A1H7FHK8_AQUAM|nr:thiol peroxidase [Aquimarina amphilecti]SEK25458.1 thiol peroxidase (atypical 2-Cys peroxiredoxin) [Aquimarina amphilecti]
MAAITLGGNAIHTNGDLPKVGEAAPDFELVNTDLSVSKLSDYKGSRVVLNIFPSIDTGVCAASVRQFNKEASNLSNTKVLCVSRDLPFAQARFCGAEGLENVVNHSDFRDGKFGKDYGLEIVDGPMKGLHSRAVVVVDQEGVVTYAEQVPEIAQEPNYTEAIKTLA